MPDYIQLFIDTLKKEYKLKIEKWIPNKNYYPQYMFLGGDRGILAYVYFIDEKNTFTSDLVLKVSRAESELDRPVFFIRNYQNTGKLYFETNEQIKDRLLNGYSNNFYVADMNTVGNYNELINTLIELKKNNVKFY